jgi:hypothetical protein
MSSPQVAAGDRIVDPMITLAGCSTRQRILLAGSKSMELMLELHRRGYLLAAAAGMRRRNRRPWYIDPIPSYYGYNGDWHYFGRPGFYGARYNGGSFGSCWTRTPIGPIWNCG